MPWLPKILNERRSDRADMAHDASASARNYCIRLDHVTP
jgi:hypothetical protein